MRRTVLALALAVGAAGCSEVITSADMTSRRFVVVDDRPYAPEELLAADMGAPGETYAVVLRFVDCSGGIWLGAAAGPEDWCPLENGDSNFLPEGTPIHRVGETDPADALTVNHEGAWVVLRPVPVEDR